MTDQKTYVHPEEKTRILIKDGDVFVQKREDKYLGSQWVYTQLSTENINDVLEIMKERDSE